MKLLMSFCNVGYLSKQHLLGIYDWEKHHLNYVSLPLENLKIDPQKIQGATGLIKTKDNYFLALQSKSPYILSLDSNFNVIACKALELVKQPHSLAFHEGYLYVISTGTNSIVRLPYDVRFGKEELHFRLEEADTDQIHLNSLAVFDNQLIVSCFGLKKGNNFIRSGYVKNVSYNKILLEGIREPHSLVKHNRDLYVLESANGCLYQITPGKKCQLVKQFSGYARGLAFEGNEVFIVRNAYRKLSRQLGDKKQVPLIDLTTEVCEWQRSWICRSKLEENTYHKKDFTAFAFEVYDIISLISEPNSINLVKDGVIHRILCYEELCAELQHQLKLLEDSQSNRLLA